MGRYLLRIEAVNFLGFLEDTSDLSTRRGGGLLLLDAPEAISIPGIAGVVTWKQVYSGASTALFEFTTQEGVDPEIVRGEVERQLHTGARAEATIMVDFEEYAKVADFQLVVAKLTSVNRRRQLKTPTIIYPECLNSVGIDQIDDKRPGYERDDMRHPIDNREIEGRNMILSETTYLRRKYGQKEKYHFYERVKLDVPAWSDFPFHGGEYVNDFDQLADNENAQPSDLNGKIAFIYFDGNQFGSIARSCTDPDSLRRWSDIVRANQDSFLNWILRVKTDAGNQSPWHWTGEPVDNSGRKRVKKRLFRIETLLWGGDEIIWVVPAWCGWWVLGCFFQHYGKLPWKVGTPAPRTSFTVGGKTWNLTHGAGIVFCHAQAPIRRIGALAHRLAETPKALGTKTVAEDKYKNYFAYQVLESFDHLGTDIQRVRENRLPPSLRGLPVSPLILSGDGMLEIFTPMGKFRERFPRSKLHSLAQAMLSGEPHCLEEADRELKRAKLEGEFETLCNYFGAQATGSHKKLATWFHIIELWDYTHEPTWNPAPVPDLP